MVSCARATRGLRRPSLDTRSGRPSSPPSREKMEERCSSDARSWRPIGPPFIWKHEQARWEYWKTIGSQVGATHYSCEWRGGVNRTTLVVGFDDHIR